MYSFITINLIAVKMAGNLVFVFIANKNCQLELKIVSFTAFSSQIA